MIVVYTALFGEADELWSTYPLAEKGYRHVCFTEKPRRQVGIRTPTGTLFRGLEDETAISTWEVVEVPIKRNPRYTARYYKALSHIHFPDARYTIWVDANVRLLIPPRKAVKNWLKLGVIAAFNHPHRKCLFEEARFCSISKGKGNPKKLKKQAIKYNKAGMPRDWGLPETKCVIRSNKPRTNLLNEAWWKELQMQSLRDQVSLPYVCWKQGVMWDVIPGRAYYPTDDLSNDAFWFIRHAT